MKTPQKIIITGGHLTPAVATIEALQSYYPGITIVFVGRHIALEGTRIESEEYRLVRAMGLRFIPLDAGRIKRDASLLAVTSFMKIPRGFFRAYAILRAEKPDAVLSFGGYLALPVVAAASLMGIPSVTHEQTSRPGLANRIIARLATRVCVSFPDAVSLSPRAVLTGLPIRKSILDEPSRQPFPVDTDRPVLFITGGSTGAVAVNTVVYRALPELLADYTVIHQVGRLTYESGSLYVPPAAWKRRYVAVPYLTAPQYSWVLHRADLVIGRSGANTVMEIAALGKIALFIPLPWAANNEQHVNAQFLRSRGSAAIIPQSSFTPESLIGEVRSMMKDRKRYQAAAVRLVSDIPRNGARMLMDQVISVLGHPHPVG